MDDSSTQLAASGRDIDEVLPKLVEERIYATGVQLSVTDIATGECLHTALGTQLGDAPLEAKHLFNVWCATKPLVALTFMRIAETHGIGPHGTVGEVLPSHAATGTTWADVLNHSAGLRSPTLLEAMLAAPDVAVERACSEPPEPAAQYSEFAAGATMCRAIEALVGSDAQDILRSTIAAWGLSDDVKVDLDEDQLQNPQDALGFYLMGLPAAALPSLHDSLPDIATGRGAAFGGYATAKGLAGIHEQVGRVLNGEQIEAMPTRRVLACWLQHQRPTSHDPALGRACSFAGGFMVGLEDHYFGAGLGPSFGHTGFQGSSFGMFHAPTGRAIGCILNGIPTDEEDLAYLRPLLVALAAQAHL